MVDAEEGKIYIQLLTRIEAKVQETGERVARIEGQLNNGIKADIHEIKEKLSSVSGIAYQARDISEDNAQRLDELNEGRTWLQRTLWGRALDWVVAATGGALAGWFAARGGG